MDFHQPKFFFMASLIKISYQSCAMPTEFSNDVTPNPRKASMEKVIQREKI